MRNVPSGLLYSMLMASSLDISKNQSDLLCSSGHWKETKFCQYFTCKLLGIQDFNYSLPTSHNKHKTKISYGIHGCPLIYLVSYLWPNLQKFNNNLRRNSQAEVNDRPQTVQGLQTAHGRAGHSCTGPSAWPVGELPSSRNWISSPNSGALSSGLLDGGHTYCVLLWLSPGVQPALYGFPTNCKPRNSLRKFLSV